MKKYVKIQYLLYSLCITLVLPFSPFAQTYEESIWGLGFPAAFYRVYLERADELGGIPVHFGIGSFLADFLAAYAAVLVLAFCWKKLKKFLKGN